MKKILKTLSLLLIIVSSITVTAQSRKGVSILGDSYSTFSGFVQPDTNRVWYGWNPKAEQTNVDNVNQTWWHLLIKENGCRLVKNNSFSGATICNTGYKGNDYTDRSFVSRAKDLGSPDVIYVFGGTNDDWAKSPLGEFKYADWTKDDLFQVRPATACMLATMIDYYPGTEIVVIINSELRPEITESLATIAKHYGLPVVRLHDIEKRAGHPTIKGMRQIADQVAAATLR